jgi:ADP-heptose:LPS heptosyltransferase
MAKDIRILAACTAGGAGDLLAALPAMSALHRHFATPLDVLATPYAAPILKGQTCVGEIATDDGREPIACLSKRLAAQHYSHAVVFWSNPRIAKAISHAGIPVRVGQARRLYSFRYTKRVNVRSETGDTRSHWTDIQMDYARALGAQPTPQDYNIVLQPSSADQTEAEELLSRTAGERPFLIFHTTRGIAADAAAWPSNQFAMIGDALARAFSATVLLTGNEREAPLATRTAAAMREPVFNVSGQTTLCGFAALATRASMVVALDSGPMHIAAAVGAPTVGIFALRTDLPNRWRPLGPRVALVGPDYPCPPRCRKETCQTFACYAALSAERVVAAAQSLLPEPTVAAP